jgi:hypothetical protein
MPHSSKTSNSSSSTTGSLGPIAGLLNPGLNIASLPTFNVEHTPESFRVNLGQLVETVEANIPQFSLVNFPNTSNDR